MTTKLLPAYPAFTSVPILDNQAVAQTLFSYSATETYKFMVFSIKRGANYQIATQPLLTDGASVVGGVSSNVIGATGVTLTKTVSGGNVLIQYTSTNTGTNGTFQYAFLAEWT